MENNFETIKNNSSDICHACNVTYSNCCAEGNYSCCGGSYSAEGELTDKDIADLAKSGSAMLSSLADTLGSALANRPQLKGEIKAACGRKPLLNIGGKKDTYWACTKEYLESKKPAKIEQKEGMGTGAIIAISTTAVLITGLIVFALTRKKAVQPTMQQVIN